MKAFAGLRIVRFYFALCGARTHLTLISAQFSWSTRLRSSQYYSGLVSLDGTDCYIMELQQFNRRWVSHKMRSAGVSYEAAVSINCDMVWVNDPYSCRSHPDVFIFRDSLKSALWKGRIFLSDKGNGEERCLTLDKIVQSEGSFAATIRARHETVNGIKKGFVVLLTRFRPNRNLHAFCFNAVANITQIMMVENPLFSIWLELNSR